MSVSTGASRGDLGFIPNINLRTANRTFFGSPGHPSKKGVNLHTSRGSIREPEPTVSVKTTETSIAGGALIERRTEYLESQERKLTATINDQRTQQQALRSDMQEHMQSNLAIMRQQQQLFTETQFVYGKVAHAPLQGVACSNEVFKTLDRVKRKRAAGEVVETDAIVAKGKWAYLIYPMEKVITPAGYQYLMRCKTVDKITGQINICWAVIFQMEGDKETRFISEFSEMPH